MPEPRFHLILVYYPDLLDPNDFEQIAAHVRARAPDIETFVIADSMHVAEIERRATSKPFLLFSPASLKRFRPTGGKIYAGHGILKLEQMALMKRGGIPVPKWQVIGPATRLSAKEWGPIVVVKPDHGSRASGIEARLTEEVRYRVPLSYPAKHPGRNSQMIVQKFIDTGPHPAKIRVLTLFGEPLYAEEMKAAEETVLPAHLTSESLKTFKILPTPPRINSFVYDADVLDLARRTHRILPDIPLQAIDILREFSTGKLFVLEMNPGGNTWHFSSRAGKRELVEGRQRHTQFDAFSVAADLLIERTRREARPGDALKAN